MELENIVTLSTGRFDSKLALHSASSGYVVVHEKSFDFTNIERGLKVAEWIRECTHRHSCSCGPAVRVHPHL